MATLRKVLVWENPKDKRFYLWNVQGNGWIKTDGTTTTQFEHPHIDSSGDRVTAFTRAAKLGFTDVETVAQNPQDK